MKRLAGLNDELCFLNVLELKACRVPNGTSWSSTFSLAATIRPNSLDEGLRLRIALQMFVPFSAMRKFSLLSTSNDFSIMTSESIQQRCFFRNILYRK